MQWSQKIQSQKAKILMLVVRQGHFLDLLEMNSSARLMTSTYKMTLI